MNATTMNRFVKHAQWTTHEPKQFGKVAVLMGGISAERDVSLKSGIAVLQGLIAEGVDAHGLDLSPASLAQLDKSFDRAFVVLHGRWGEDGAVQGLLDSLQIPYTGSNVLGCALAMDKVRSKQVWQAIGLPTADFRVVTESKQLIHVANDLGLPLFMKPAREGSSVGVGKVIEVAKLEETWAKTAAFGDDVIAEQFISGDELTVAVLEGRALPIIRMSTANEFYDYEAKYESNETIYECPADLSEELTERVQDLAVRAFKSLGCSGWGRVDLMLDSDGQPLLLEVNTVPGMTDHSLVPMAAAQVGLSFSKLCVEILASTLVEKQDGTTQDKAVPDKEGIDE